MHHEVDERIVSSRFLLQLLTWDLVDKSICTILATYEKERESIYRCVVTAAVTMRSLASLSLSLCSFVASSGRLRLLERKSFVHSCVVVVVVVIIFVIILIVECAIFFKLTIFFFFQVCTSTIILHVYVTLKLKSNYLWNFFYNKCNLFEYKKQS